MKNLFLYIGFVILITSSFTTGQTYSWVEKYDSTNSLIHQIPPPQGFERVGVEANSFADWLRHIPLKPGKPDVLLHYGIEKRNQDIHHAVIDIDVGRTNLQHGINAVIRLRGEYLYAAQKYSDLHFNFKTGHRVSFSNWTQGYRPIVSEEGVMWVQSGDKGTSYRKFKNYIVQIMMHGGPPSLLEKTMPVLKTEDIKAGHIFLRAENLGNHAVLVMDVAENSESGEKVFLVSQSYIPAQDIHILINPNDEALSPWYSLDFGDTLITPEWKFSKTALKQF